MSSWDYWALAAVLLTGIPHGGFDGAIARRAGWSNHPLSWLMFHSGYVILAALVTAIWWYQPGPSLTIFLAISAIHFGTSDIRMVTHPWRWSCAIPLAAHCGLVSIGIPGLNPQEVEPLFSILIGIEPTLLLLQGIAILLPIWLFAVVAYIAQATLQPQWRRSAGLLLALLFATYWFEPLVCFSLYFCFVHSPVHSLRIWRSLLPQDRRRCALEAVSYTLAAWISGLLLILWYRQNYTIDLDSALLQLTFIGLAALTVPHMILVDILDHKHD
ncbi:MAG: Brp/Blh family beta-carotene 15,15'-dioxygenase [Porticoccaceae bacterium]|nr:Brp/Blh family beta-carotene 15,15'-dioxygenase [Porticoccaceae bacterium]